MLVFYALPTEPNSSIFSFTVALMASNPGASSFLGSKPLPERSLPSSIYLRVAAAKDSNLPTLDYNKERIDSGAFVDDYKAFYDKL